ncbi:MAG: hypothetical protein IJA34_00110 [Lachnospiraceae bacterium]|nr:hypothetical protein [Lachnospiraceae bacterium]MBQ6992850.1 hypothetical protein [Clostridia bacterium]
MASFLTSKLGMVGTVISFTSVGGAIMNLWDMCDNGKIDGYVNLVKVIYGEISFGELTIIIMYIRQISTSFIRIVMAISEFQRMGCHYQLKKIYWKHLK